MTSFKDKNPMNKQEKFHEILNFPNTYIVNETYRRLSGIFPEIDTDESASGAYQQIINEQLSTKSLFQKLIALFRTGYIIYLFKEMIGWIFFGYLAQFAYIFIKDDIYQSIQTAPQEVFSHFDISGMHQNVFILIIVVLIIKIFLLFIKKTVNSTEEIAIEELPLDKAYSILRVDEYDSFSYIKLKVSKILTKNKKETNKTLQAYLTIAKHYDFEREEKIIINSKAIFVFLKNFFVSFGGWISKSVVLVPFLYFYVWFQYNIISIEMGNMMNDFIQITNQFFIPIYNFVLSLPFSQYFPLLDSFLGCLYAVCIFIGVLLIIYEFPNFIMECMRQFKRSMNFGKTDKETQVPKITVNSNNMKNKFNVFRLGVIFYFIVFLIVKFFLKV